MIVLNSHDLCYMILVLVCAHDPFSPKLDKTLSLPQLKVGDFWILGFSMRRIT